MRSAEQLKETDVTFGLDTRKPSKHLIADAGHTTILSLITDAGVIHGDSTPGGVADYYGTRSEPWSSLTQLASR